MVFRGKYFIQRLLQNLAVLQAVSWDFFASIVNPQVHDAGVVLEFSHLLTDPTAAFGVFYPETADRFIRIRQCQVPALRVGERGAVKIQLQSVFFRPLHPTGEMLGLNFVAVHHFALEVPINGMKIETMLAWNEACDFDCVGSHFINRAGTSGIIASHLDASG